VVSVVKFPADIDLYQAQKGIDNAKLALKENGILILVAKCRCGIGGKAFADLLGSCDTPQEVLDTIEKGYKLGYHKAAKMAEIGRWAEMWGVTDVPDEELSQLFIKPFKSLQEALDKALEQKGYRCRCYVPHGWQSHRSNAPGSITAMLAHGITNNTMA